MHGSLGKVSSVIAGVGVAIVSSVAVGGSAHAAARHVAVAAADTVTGCLSKGDEKGEYMLTGKDGKKYGLRSTKVALSKHVGHTVTVVGTTYKEDEDEDEKAEKSKASEEVADLRVTSLTMVSATCQ